jgi:hypothetical protein
MTVLTLPAEVESVLRAFRACEFSTLARDGTPISWPASAQYQAAEGRFFLTTSLGLSQKALNIRRNSRIAMLYSDPTGSGLVSPPAVLVQGDAVVPEEVVTSLRPIADYWIHTIMKRQPASAMYHRNALMRKLSDWYYMRLFIHVTPRAIYWWPAADFSRPPHKIEANNHVG